MSARDLPGGAPPEPIAYFQGNYLRESDCRLSIRDRGFLHGDGLFETLRAYRGFPFALDRHLARLGAGLRALGIAAEADAALWDPVARGLVRVNGLEETDAEVRIAVSRGPAPASPEEAETPTVLATVRPLPERARRAADGLRAATLRAPRSPGPFAALKTANYLECAMGLREARAAGADEGLFVDASGAYLEGCTTNLFAVAGGALRTAERGVLPGVTRGIVLEIAGELGITVRLGALPAEALRGAEELFVTNSLIEAAGVVALDGRAVGGGEPGAITRRIAEAYRARAEAERAKDAAR